MSNSLNSGSNATAGGGGGSGSGGGGGGSGSGAGSGTFIDKIDPFKNQGRIQAGLVAIYIPGWALGYVNEIRNCILCICIKCKIILVIDETKGPFFSPSLSEQLLTISQK